MFRRGAATVYLWLEGLFGFAFSAMFTLAALYRIDVIGLNPFQLVLLGTALEVAALILEVPTGVVADTISRRLSILLGIFTFGIAAFVEGLFPIFWVVMLAQILWALGYTFLSGATEAWITDEVGEDQAAKLFRQAVQVRMLTGLVGIGVGSGLGLWNLRAPFFLGGFLLIGFGIWIAPQITEHNWQRDEHSDDTTWVAMRKRFLQGWNTVRGSSLLILLMVISILSGAWSETTDRLWEAQVLEWNFPTWVDWPPAIWFGVISISMTVVVFGAMSLFNRWIAGHSPETEVQALFWAYTGLMLAASGFALASNFTIGIICLFAVTTLRKLTAPLMTAWLNRNIESRVRATVLSFNGQADALGQIMGGPLLGWLATAVSLRASLLVGAMLLVPILFLRPARRKHSEAIPETSV